MENDDQASGHFEVLEHTADIGFLAEASTPEALFETAARALLDIAADTSAAEPRERLDVRVEGEDYPSLLVNFLDELLYLFDADRCVPALVRVTRATETSVVARLEGEPRNPSRHPWKVIVKGVTYHDLEVAERDGRWHARVFLDV